ncbi:Serine-threonine/tyrosine-protein kinase, catalytic domain [Dillenia turbinata]|uniref:Serine-threonine/tyrosine-protein kinase, catalytic domain n=1 Tax=Dillenia turbinata TaxID=194707 RepID=A0AAN8ZBT0_9MAGN
MMNCNHTHLSSSSLLFLSLVISGLFRLITCATFVGRECLTSPTFPSNGTYQASLNLLFSSLTSNSNSSNGFYNISIGNQAPDIAYGLFLCRGDVSSDICQVCVAAAQNDLMQNCAEQTVAITYYQECLLRYSNRSIFSTMSNDPEIVIYNESSVREQRDKFYPALADALNDAAAQAANGSTKKFATKEAKFTENKTWYTLAQCTPDLSSDDCKKCLQFGIGRVIQGAEGSIGMFPSCQVRYALFPFYNGAFIAPEPLPASRPTSGDQGIHTTTIIATVVPATLSASILIALCYTFLRRKKRTAVVEDDEDEISLKQSFIYDLRTIQAATNDFSKEKRIGEGGSGSVYKGTLSNGEEVAVKRLSQGSEQSAEEFKNEVALVARLLHRNLVRVLGFCSEGQENILIYEYVPNKSLDHFLSGLAHPNTGYMAPEYAMQGHVSVKSDVFSFGVLVLEIVSGKKNSTFHESGSGEDLLSYAWKLWNNNEPFILVDSTIRNSFSTIEVLRSIAIGLLCVKEDPNDRPTMASVVLMLESFSVTLPLPQLPEFPPHTRPELELNYPVNDLDTKELISNDIPVSNEISISELEPR